ncbi:rhomboid family intramembrane serine protease [Roseimaritima ulvae]|uniref:Rhomboid protease GluP n=1 Tax=Roseimaritima ulvae TaxID=980254 RepID=A0A5B9QVZ0_9BACT|nr:rhomboid family intramembrane serine protease [Roseimaritima ulvae]QEG43207.1 Rhomboid protease GluP [Roseimaritima ulvae]
MLFPISDDDREVTTVAYVTNAILLINVLVFLVQMSDPAITYGYSVVPQEITSGVDLVEPQMLQVEGHGAVTIPQAPGPRIIWLTLLTSMFMHGGFGHIAGNMLYLWIFGNNVEHRFGHVWFLVFYLVAGLAGSLAQIASNPGSIIPNLGASGAIAGVMGAYLVLFPRNRVNAVFFYVIVTIPAVWVLGMWIAMQFVNSVGSIAATSESAGGVAYLAHVGGFVAGVLAALLCRMMIRREPDSELRRQYQHDPRARQIW